MMEGTYYKEWSAVLDREMEFKVYGHGGVPVLALPARGGRFYDWENNGMPDAAARLLHEGKFSSSAPTASTARACWPAMSLPAAGPRCRRSISSTSPASWPRASRS